MLYPFAGHDQAAGYYILESESPDCAIVVQVVSARWRSPRDETRSSNYCLQLPRGPVEPNQISQSAALLEWNVPGSISDDQRVFTPSTHVRRQSIFPWLVTDVKTPSPFTIDTHFPYSALPVEVSFAFVAILFNALNGVSAHHVRLTKIYGSHFGFST